MATKANLSDDVNEMLGTDIKWQKLNKDDLETLHMLVDEGHLMEPMAKHMAKQHGKSKIDEMIDDWRPGTVVSKLL